MNNNLRKTNPYWVPIAILILLSSFSLKFFRTAPATAASLRYDSLRSIVTMSGGVDEVNLLSRKVHRMPELRPLKTRQGTATPHIMSLETTKKLRNTIAGNKSPRRRGEKRALISNAQCENLRSLVAANQFGEGVRSYFNRKNGTPAFIKLPKRAQKLTRNTKNLAMSQSVAEKFLMDNRNLLKLSEPTKELIPKRHWVDRFGTKHLRYQQTYQGIPLWGKGVMVHLDAYDSVYLCQGRYEPTPESLDITPGITADEALEATMRHLEITTDCLHSAKTALVIYTAYDGRMTLTYKVEISPSIDQRWIYFIDTDNGTVVHRINNIHNTVDNASGIDLNSQNRTFNAWLAEGAYYLIDPTIPLEDPPYAPVPDIKSFGNTYILDARNGDSELYFITSSSADSGWDSAGVSAAYNTRKVYDYYKNTFGRNGIDDNNMNYLIVVHLKENYANAFWNGRFVCFGDGDNQTFSALAGSLDITAHEIQHGVTEFTAGLIYENQSGALNEAYSDIFACMVDRDDWTVGEEITLVSPGYLRNLANPALGLDPLPTKMSEYRNLPNTEQGDHGGVHINMSIPSRAAYLIAEGLTTEGLGASIGRDKTEKIFFRALTTYLQASSQFLDARVATIQAAEDLYGGGSTEVSAVQAAWDVVEVTEGNVGAPDDQAPTPTEPVSGDDLMVYLYPIDGSHDKPYDPSEAYDLYVQTIPSPFTGYDPSMDSIDLNRDVYTSYTRPAAYTGSGGTVIFYVGSDNNLYAVERDGGNHTQITETEDIWSFAIAPDGGYFAYTTVSTDDDNIYVCDLDTGLVTEYPVESPSDLPPGSEEVGNTIFYVDSLAFDYTGKTIVFDALNCLSTPGNPCSLDNGGYRYWSIGFLNLSNGSFDFPFSGQSPDFDIEYPSFAYNNNFVVVLDVLDYSDYYTSDTVSSMVWTMNWQTQASAQVADPNLGSDTRGVSGVPSFWGDDDYVTIQCLSDTNGLAFRVPIDASWARNESEAELLLNDYDVAMPVMHRAVARTLTGTIQLSSSFFDFGNVNLGDTSSLNVTLTNTGNRDINIYDIEISGSSAFSHNGSNGLLPHGQSMTFRVTFLPGQTIGTQAGTLTITSDADSPTTSIALTGTGGSQNGYLSTDAGEDRTVGEGEHIVLDGSGTSVTGDEITSYSWHQTSGTPVFLLDNNTARAWFAAPYLEDYWITLTFQLSVETLGGIQDQDEITVYVYDTQADKFPDYWDEDDYLAANPDVAAVVSLKGFSSGYEHYMRYGKYEGRRGGFSICDYPDYWDESAYLNENSDVSNAVLNHFFNNGYEHYLIYGEVEGRIARVSTQLPAYWDEAGYLSINTDVADAIQAGWFSNGFEHYINWGCYEGRRGGLTSAYPDFWDEHGYLTMNSDVADAVMNGFFSQGYEHYVLYGEAEGRCGGF